MTVEYHPCVAITIDFRRVLLNSGAWQRDTTLRVECLHDTENCCRNVRLESEAGVGPAHKYHNQLLGTYTATGLRNARFWYLKDQGSIPKTVYARHAHLTIIIS